MTFYDDNKHDYVFLLFHVFFLYFISEVTADKALIYLLNIDHVDGTLIGKYIC